MSDRREAIKQAYVETIRTVLILDDKYPDYDQIGNKLDPERYDVDSAVRLWQGFRNKHRTCDICSNSATVGAPYLDRLDLLVLDYDLQMDDGGHKGKAAREIIRGLATSTRQNMVIVYTADDQFNDVQLAISASCVAT